jgi:hypothetical protein
VASEVRDRDRAQGVRERLQRGRWADCDDLVEAVYGRCGRCDVLVSNAGMSPLYPDLPSVTEELYDKTHAVNAKGPFR